MFSGGRSNVQWFSLTHCPWEMCAYAQKWYTIHSKTYACGSCDLKLSWVPSGDTKTLRHLTAKFLEVARLDECIALKFWQPSRQCRCRGACQISERMKNSKYESRDFGSSRDLAVRQAFIRLVKKGPGHTIALMSVKQPWSDVDLSSKIFHGIHPSSHFGDVIMGTIASQITSLAIVFSTVYLDTDKKNQTSASLALCG